MKALLSIASLILLLTQQACSQSDRYAVHEIRPKATYLEDFNQLVDSIQTYHPQPYEFIAKDSFDQFVNLKKSMITDSTSIGEFSWICSAIASKVGCVHTYTSAGQLLNFSQEMFFPVPVQYIDAKLYIIDTYPPNNELKSGVEILKINGIEVLDLRTKIAAHISSDGHNQKYIDARINRSFGYFCAYQLNFPKVYKVEIRENGVKKEVLLNKELPDSRSSSNSPTENLDFTLKKHKNLAIVTIKSFVYYNDRLPVFKSFIDSCFNQIRLHDIGNVVIDLRGNGGGDPYCAVHLLQYLSDDPFSYYKKGTTTYYKDLEEKIIPFENNFSGKLYVLINSLCSSTTGHLCSILKHNKLGTLIGSETGATYSCNAKTINFELKNTGINASVATKTYQTAVTGFAKNRGIIPDYQMSENLDEILAKKDTELEKVLELMLDE
ncbi:MAG: S41 family peptidase [Bacteroidota bacterium]